MATKKVGQLIFSPPLLFRWWDPGSGWINIPDPQHCTVPYYWYAFFLTKGVVDGGGSQRAQLEAVVQPPRIQAARQIFCKKKYTCTAFTHVLITPVLLSIKNIRYRMSDCRCHKVTHRPQRIYFSQLLRHNISDWNESFLFCVIIVHLWQCSCMKFFSLGKLLPTNAT